MEKATLASSKVGSISVTLAQLVTPVEIYHFDYMHHAINMGNQNIGVL